MCVLIANLQTLIIQIKKLSIMFHETNKYKTREPGWFHALLMITMYDEEENEKKHSISISSWTQKKLMKQKIGNTK